MHLLAHGGAPLKARRNLHDGFGRRSRLPYGQNGDDNGDRQHDRSRHRDGDYLHPVEHVRLLGDWLCGHGMPFDNEGIADGCRKHQSHKRIIQAIMRINVRTIFVSFVFGGMAAGTGRAPVEPGRASSGCAWRESPDRPQPGRGGMKEGSRSDPRERGAALPRRLGQVEGYAGVGEGDAEVGVAAALEG